MSAVFKLQSWISLDTSSLARPLSGWLLSTERSVKPSVGSLSLTLALMETSLWLLAGTRRVLGLTLQLLNEGALVSILTVSGVVAVLPALSLTLQDMLWVPSPETLAFQVSAVEPAMAWMGHPTEGLMPFANMLSLATYPHPKPQTTC